MRLVILLMGLACSGIKAFGNEDFRPPVNATKGEMFPQSQYKELTGGLLMVRPDNFSITLFGDTCDILHHAIERYVNIISEEAQIASNAALPLPETFLHQKVNMINNLTGLEIHLGNSCERLPYLNMNENYTLEINETRKMGILIANDVWGILRGLESFSQLLVPSSDGYLTINCQKIVDFPSFPHRGLLLDTSSHYILIEDIMLTLDAMSYNKLNVFHWHITDDNSFPYVSTAFPELSAKGAYHPSLVYTPENVATIVEYARLRGIRVIAEIDTPAHTRSIGQSYPELLTQCWERGKPSGKLGPMNPTTPVVLPFLNTLFNELFEAFPDRYIHLGGDEIFYDCWKSNPEIQSYMIARGIYTMKDLVSKYFGQLFELSKTANVTPIVWQEVFTSVRDLSPDVVIHIWQEWTDWKDLMIDVLSNNHSVIVSTGWHLDVSKDGDWKRFYTFDPLSFDGTPEMKSRVLGGEACMWTEHVDRYNVHSAIWPRASAAAERLWSNPTFDTDEVARRLEEHTCRMNRRGIDAQPPNGPGFCLDLTQRRTATNKATAIILYYLNTGLRPPVS